MEMREVIIDEKTYYWKSEQTSEHPDLEVSEKGVTLHIQVEVDKDEATHNEKFLNGLELAPISEKKVAEVINALIENDSFQEYKNSDIGLIYSEDGSLIEN